MRRILFRTLCIIGSLILLSPLHAQDWPLHVAKWNVVLHKDINATPPPHEPSDLSWFHLHRGHPTLPNSSVNTIAPIIVDGWTELDPMDSGIELRYTVHGVAVSPWLQPPFRFELSIDNPALAQLTDGIHDLSIEARGANRADFKPLRSFVHITSDKAAGEPFGFSKEVPIITSMQALWYTSVPHSGPSVVYVDPAERNHVGYPVSPNVTPWQQPPNEAPLYQESMAPHTELFNGVQLWWDHPAHNDAPFVRAISPEQGQDHRGLRVKDRHERFPMSDGPRSVGWMSPYVSGQIDSQGRFAFAEVGGRIGYLMPDGEIITIAGWRVAPGKDPIWFGKPTAQVRQNMQLRGNWLNGRGEFLTPLDIAIDPQDESIWYVVSYEDHVVWKVELPTDVRNQDATVSVFAGDPDHTPGSADGNGQQARFNGPASIVFDPVNDVMYVADQDNDAIRQITRSGEVSTLFGQPGMQQRVSAAGVEWFDQLAARSVSVVEVSATQAQQGIRPDIYLPQVIRVDSEGNIILLEIGFGAIRRLDPQTGTADTLGEVQQTHAQFQRGWAWLDVDRYGNSGVKDGIYWCKYVNTLPGESFSEVFEWLPPEGGESIPLFSSGTGLYPDGWGRQARTNPPHYPWLVAVDPRGALLMSGGGEHGITRLRLQKDDDPIESENDYWLGRNLFNSGSNEPTSVAGTANSLKYGFGGHNHLGFTNAWGLSAATDEQLLDAFDASTELRNSPVARRQWLSYVRPNTHSSSDTTEIVSMSLPNNQWRQISLPCDAGSNSTVASLFADDGLGSYNQDWKIWEFDAINNSYIDVNLQTTLRQGVGYWIMQNTDSAQQLTMPGNCINTPKVASAGCPLAEGCFSTELFRPAESDTEPGQYQMLGYPFSSTGSVSTTYVSTNSGPCAEGCPIDAATGVSEIVVPIFWSYDGTEYQELTPGGTYSPWSGFWALGLPAASGTTSRLSFGQAGL